MRYVIFVALAATAFAQDLYEVGANVGYGWYNDGTIYGPGVSAEAGIRNRFAAGIDLGWQFSDYVSAQFSYLYHDGHPFLQTSTTKVDIQGNSDALTIAGLFHFAKREKRFRPFLAGGVGGKEYVIAGPEPYPQPLPQIATLTENDVWKVVFTVGGGFTYRLIPHMLIRGEFRDYLTTFDRQEIVPAPHNTARGIFEQFTPLFGLSYTF